jgi:hypothetical protein
MRGLMWIAHRRSYVPLRALESDPLGAQTMIAATRTTYEHIDLDEQGVTPCSTAV